MKFTRKWLLEHWEGDMDAEAIGRRLTQAGLEVGSITRLDKGLEKVQAGRLLEVGRHPDADRLTVCKVNVGQEELTIVCGAKNHKAFDMVAVAREGATLPNGMKIGKSRIRGQMSQGMLASEAELGLAASAEGILILPEGTISGTPLAVLLGRDDDLFELELTPNRGDCLGVRGIARELSALTGQRMRPLTAHVEVTDTTPAQVVIEHRTGCPRYAGRIIRGVRVAPSPFWLKNRLESVGLRSINNVVDITNLILLDLNQPMHAFDLGQLALPLIVRSAFPGEKLTTLDGTTHELGPDNLLIADSRRPLALAGIMGGMDTGVTESTTSLFLEAAFFNPLMVTRTGRRLGINSDSRFRFERGIDPLGLTLAMERATELILELCGGRAGPVTMAETGAWNPGEPIRLRHERINRLAGIHLSNPEMEEKLVGLGCEKIMVGEQTFFKPPSHRHDLVLEEDLLEEIVRLHGYDNVTPVLPRMESKPAEFDARETLSWTLRRRMASLGYLETINYSFVSKVLQHRFDPEVAAEELVNPISEDMAVLRTSLCPGLLDSARRNLSRGNLNLRLFEAGHVFLPGQGQNQGHLVERERLAGLVTGERHSRAWHNRIENIDFFDLKGDLEHLVASLGCGGMVFEPGGPEFLHPGQKAVFHPHDLGRPIGWIGMLHPEHQRLLDPAQVVFMFEFALDDLHPHLLTGNKGDCSLSRFPALERDFAFLVDQTVGAGPFMEAMAKIAPGLIQNVRLFDVYKGENLPQGKKSFAINVVFRASDRTLTDQEAQELCARIVETAQSLFGAQQR
ncbi:MAG: phenylalanyl-tRNA synthetase beta subunit [Magnetococcales bacterium]|nr:phenylalanyl-tRNA synthetase beta subunit [Magnetococcales bacterium]HIJ82718.1 phenylalanine--tRNA ligase subunit beta [Magnetococcales bacterium]